MARKINAFVRRVAPLELQNTDDELSILTARVGATEHDFILRSSKYCAGQKVPLTHNELYTGIDGYTAWVLDDAIEYGQFDKPKGSDTVSDWQPKEDSPELESLYLEAIVRSMINVGSIREYEPNKFSFATGKPNPRRLAEHQQLLFSLGVLLAEYVSQKRSKNAALEAMRRSQRGKLGGKALGNQRYFQAEMNTERIERLANRTIDADPFLRRNYSKWAHAILKLDRSDRLSEIGDNSIQTGHQQVRKTLSALFPRATRKK